MGPITLCLLLGYIFAADGLSPDKWIVQIQRDGTHICMGTTVNNRHVLTLGGCIDGTNADEYRLVFNGGIKRRVSRILKSPVGRLLVLLRFNQKIHLTSSSLGSRKVARPQLANQAKKDRRHNLVHSWEKKNGMEDISVDVVGDGQCKQIYADAYRVKRHMCNRALSRKRKICSIMGGQPILTRDNSKSWLVIGVSLAADDICNGEYYKAIETAPHIKWIKQMLKQRDCGTPVVPSDASVTYTDTVSGSTATYACDEAFVHTAGDLSRTCQSNRSWSGISATCTKATDCYDLFRYKNIVSGIHKVMLWNSSEIVDVVCDSDTDGGGWTVFQNRIDNTTDFYRNFANYTAGFGDLNSNFWLGLQYIQEIAAHGSTELRLDLSAADGSSVFENFQNFYLGNGPGYRLYNDLGTGTAGDFFGMTFNRGYRFTTNDHDMDIYSGNCAVKYGGAWWYRICTYVNLNGRYITPGTTIPRYIGGGIIYYPFKGDESLQTSKMMLRRIDDTIPQ